MGGGFTNYEPSLYYGKKVDDIGENIQDAISVYAENSCGSSAIFSKNITYQGAVYFYTDGEKYNPSIWVDLFEMKEDGDINFESTTPNYWSISLTDDPYDDIMTFTWYEDGVLYTDFGPCSQSIRAFEKGNTSLTCVYEVKNGCKTRLGVELDTGRTMVRIESNHGGNIFPQGDTLLQKNVNM